MFQATININDTRERILTNICKLENKKINSLIEDAIDNYIEQYKESIEITNNNDFMEMIRKGKAEIEQHVKGISIDELED